MNNENNPWRVHACPECGGILLQCKTGDPGCLHCNNCGFSQGPPGSDRAEQGNDMKKSEIPSTAINGCDEQLADLLENFDNGADLLEWLKAGSDVEMLDDEDAFFDYGFLFGVASSMGVTTEVLVTALLPETKETERDIVLRLLRELLDSRAEYGHGVAFEKLLFPVREVVVTDAARDLKITLTVVERCVLVGSEYPRPATRAETKRIQAKRADPHFQGGDGGVARVIGGATPVNEPPEWQGNDTNRKRMLRALRQLVEARLEPAGPAGASYRDAVITQLCMDLDIEINENEREVLR